jgi:hypothetical protein
VEIGGLRHQDSTGVLTSYADSDSGYRGRKAKGRWPSHIDPDDMSRVNAVKLSGSWLDFDLVGDVG